MNATLPHPAEKALALVQSTSLTRLVVESIEDMILGGDLLPGSKLNEMALAQRFGVSRGPLREALRTLEESGLIRQEKNRGAHVREIRLSEAADIYDVRAGLDATAGRLLAGRITDEQLHTLRDMTEAMRGVQPADVDRFHELNLGFHDCIVAMTGNQVLTEQYRRLCKLLALFRRRNLLAPRAIPHFAEEHCAIVDLLAAHDGRGASEALFAHAQGGRQRMLKGGELAGIAPAIES
ncbi:phosphonate utilization transcriptional regulator [Sphaerotilus hippei]|uniref:Phosphonate utilization transcriptional regulator n=1 Tax=Sphaerotilus hippei TaxID=744406 RepID=A0A318GYK0_9BURK|nr:FCD domain-containing protein [Sphaerotilus hippei]PXW95207.1 phosphonate utilization transcriptional regulator [Sphaerotilus hippei]